LLLETADATAAPAPMSSTKPTARAISTVRPRLGLDAVSPATMRVDELSWGEDTDIFLCGRDGLQMLQAMNGDGVRMLGMIRRHPADVKAKTSFRDPRATEIALLQSRCMHEITYVAPPQQRRTSPAVTPRHGTSWGDVLAQQTDHNRHLGPAGRQDGSAENE